MTDLPVTRTTRPDDSIPAPLPNPRSARSIGDLVDLLRETKLAVGDPSVRELTRQINRARRLSGRGHAVAVSTVGYCFSPSRARIDRGLLIEVLTAMGLGPRQLADWSSAWRITSRSAPATVRSLRLASSTCSVRASDLVMVIEDGRIVEWGRHDQLLEARGRYAQIHEGPLS